MSVTDLIAWLDAAPRTGDLKHATEKAAAIRDWALTQLPITEGQRVTLTRDLVTNKATSPGWWAYREALTEGATATVTDIDFHVHGRRWQAAIVLDRQWAVTDWGGAPRRYWQGTAADTPDGYEPPSTYDQRDRPEGKRSEFWVNLDALTLAPDAPSPEGQV